METMLAVSHLKKTFRLSRKQQKIAKTRESTKVAVDDLSFTVASGEVYGLLGPNGAGKTTTLRIISTLIKADEGDVLVDGSSVNKEAGEVRKKIGFLTSELKLEDFFTPNYLFDYFAGLHHIPDEEIEKRKRYLFGKFGIDQFAEVKVGDLSTGMKQKVSIVISIIHDPKIIIFDEPTNGLDIITAKTVIDFLLDLKKEGKTVILSTHIFSLVEKVCDRVGIIFDGKMVKDDLLADMTAEKSLEEVFFDLYRQREEK